MFGKNLKRELYIISFLLLITLSGLIFNGCENVTQSASNIRNVEGRIFGLFNYPFQGVKVTAGGKSAVTDINGSFVIPNVERPYELSVLDSAKNRFIYIPKHDNDSYNRLAIGYLTDFGYSDPATIKATYPDSIVSSGIRFIFTDFWDKNYYDNIQGPYGEINIPIPDGISYKGSLIAVTYTMDSHNHIFYFNKYCRIDNIIVNAHQNINISLNSSDFKAVPVNATYHVDFNIPPGQNMDLGYFTLLFGGRMTINALNLMSFEIINTTSIDLSMPRLPLLNNYLIAGFVSSGNSSHSNVFYSLTDNKELNAPQVPILAYPPENASVDINTEFIFNQGLNHVDKKYYKLTLRDTIQPYYTENRIFEVYLEKERFNISELENIGGGSLKGKRFYWDVEVYEGKSLYDGITDGYDILRKSMTGCMSRAVNVNP